MSQYIAIYRSSKKYREMAQLASINAAIQLLPLDNECMLYTLAI